MDTSSHSKCPYCPGSSKSFTSRGLNIHIGRMHKDVSRSSVPTAPVATIQSAAGPSLPTTPSHNCLEDLVSLKNSTRVLRHIPKGARTLAASKLCEIISRCLSTNNETDWFILLSFGYTALRTPENTGTGSLTSKVKINVEGNSYLLPTDKVSFKPPSVVKAIESKVHEGDVRSAVRLLVSDDTFAQSSPDTLASLQSKHPSPSRPLLFPPLPDCSTPPLKVNVEDVSSALNSFDSSSAAGLDGIRPSHLKELTSHSAGDYGPKLLECLTKLANFLLSGQLNPVVCPFLYGASLCALKKKDGGCRPIAVGSVFRRLVAKLGCRAVRNEVAAYLCPNQLGFGTQLGCEAAIHATRAYASDPVNSACVILKLDIKNAFNSLERDILLREARDKIPILYNFLHQLYHAPSRLYFGETLISSQIGAQQGDPLGPLVFSLAIHKVISDLQSPLNIWYLDDGTIGGKPETVERDLASLIPRLAELGLEVSTAKCECFPCSTEANPHLPRLESLIPGLKILDSTSFFLLGSAIFPAGVPNAIEVKKRLLESVQERLKQLSAHVALLLLRMCFATPKITYLLRTAPTWLFPEELASFDFVVKHILETILNISLGDNQWDQAALPIRCGGLGVRRAGDVGLPAFLASAHGVADLVANILSIDGGNACIPFVAEAKIAWLARHPGASIPRSPDVQREWDDVGAKSYLGHLTEISSGADLARIKAVSQPESGAWLHALPSPHLGTLLDNDSLRVAAALRLGCNVCEPHVCICGSTVESNGHHALSCCRCSGRFPRHHALNDVIRRALVSANVPCKLEPPGLSRADGKRPDGLTLVPWQRGRCLLWDATCVSTFAPCHLSRTIRTPGAAAEFAALKKTSKYNDLARNYIFVPIAVETSGCWGAEAKTFVAELGRRLRERCGDPRAGSFLVQRLAVAIQCGNAASVMGTFAPGSPGASRGGL